MKKLIATANEIIVLWRKFGPNTAAIDLHLALTEIILPKSGGDKCHIFYDRFDSFEGLMARDGANREWRIGVSTRIKYLPRRNFTLAHELGHFIGHRYQKSVFECTFDNINNFQDSGLEKEANEFAAHLLMPPDTVRAFSKGRRFNHDAVSDLASLLGVSRAAAAYRWVALSSDRIGFSISRDGFFTQGRASDSLFQCGVFFRHGEEIPASSLISQLNAEGEHLEAIRSAPIWHPFYECHESSYAAQGDGYIYTYVDFDRL